ncbi:MAG: DUF3990 domain-containing protein [Termitinemataceae bacterium]|nr:MAG: DUF3990 domain-containing protein [Termitinemataceae bacterium]
MILYHGSNIEIEKIDLNKCLPCKDFGRGFYTTLIETQALDMAKRKVDMYGGVSCITEYSLPDAIFSNTDLKHRTFEKPNAQWAIFVVNNRNRNFTNMSDPECNNDNKYDIVQGPVANDNIRFSFDLFDQGFITIENLLERLKYKNLTNQISFHTENAICFLTKTGVHHV